VRVVCDTNVLVQALITAQGPANTIVGLALIRSFTLLIDQRIRDEYDEVLTRSRFGFHRSDVQHLLKRIDLVGITVEACSLPGGTKGFPDPDDVPFLKVAVSGQAQALVTTNLRHFPASRRQGIAVVTPREFVQRYVHIG
jgi:putative PIN family toxin of toxin-antitoxin system